MNDNTEPGVFLFTLDTEFAWGHYDMFDARMFSADGSRERRAVTRILDLLDEFEIKATWAIVGRLFCSDYQACQKLSGLDWIDRDTPFGEMLIRNHPLLYAPDMVEGLIKRDAGHEIGFHGFSHRVFTGLSEADAHLEIKAWMEVTAPYGIKPLTVVFPRNRINHLPIFKEHGFLCYRGAEEYPGWFASPSWIGKGLRRDYRYTSIVAIPDACQARLDSSGLYDFTASRYLFSIDRKWEGFLRRLNLETTITWAIVRGIQKAGRLRKNFHLFAHPYEFVTEDDFKKLRNVLRAARAEIDRGTMTSCTTATLAKSLIGRMGG